MEDEQLTFVLGVLIKADRRAVWETAIRSVTVLLEFHSLSVLRGGDCYILLGHSSSSRAASQVSVCQLLDRLTLASRYFSEDVILFHDKYPQLLDLELNEHLQISYFGPRLCFYALWAECYLESLAQGALTSLLLLAFDAPWYLFLCLWIMLWRRYQTLWQERKQHILSTWTSDQFEVAHRATALSNEHHLVRNNLKLPYFRRRYGDQVLVSEDGNDVQIYQPVSQRLIDVTLQCILTVVCSWLLQQLVLFLVFYIPSASVRITTCCGFEFSLGTVSSGLCVLMAKISPGLVDAWLYQGKHLPTPAYLFQYNPLTEEVNIMRDNTHAYYINLSIIATNLAAYLGYPCFLIVTLLQSSEVSNIWPTFSSEAHIYLIQLNVLGWVLQLCVPFWMDIAFPAAKRAFRTFYHRRTSTSPRELERVSNSPDKGIALFSPSRAPVRKRLQKWWKSPAKCRGTVAFRTSPNDALDSALHKPRYQTFYSDVADLYLDTSMQFLLVLLLGVLCPSIVPSAFILMVLDRWLQKLRLAYLVRRPLPLRVDLCAHAAWDNLITLAIPLSILGNATLMIWLHWDSTLWIFVLSVAFCLLLYVVLVVRLSSSQSVEPQTLLTGGEPPVSVKELKRSVSLVVTEFERVKLAPDQNRAVAGMPENGSRSSVTGVPVRNPVPARDDKTPSRSARKRRGVSGGSERKRARAEPVKRKRPALLASLD